MKFHLTLKTLLTVPIALFSMILSAQISPGVYIGKEQQGGKAVTHELKFTELYMTHTTYQEIPPKFIKTVGGFYNAKGGKLNLSLEFNSQYQKDSISEMEVNYAANPQGLTVDGIALNKLDSNAQDLDGEWLFATRGPDNGQERRDDENARKTLKFLKNGRFQWIAYNTDTFKFFGSGGGSYSAEEGVYIENIEYFSRDDSRVGAKLDFSYELKGEDWHHQGKNSKGEPMYEIWAKR